MTGTLNNVTIIIDDEIPGDQIGEAFQLASSYIEKRFATQFILYTTNPGPQAKHFMRPATPDETKAYTEPGSEIEPYHIALAPDKYGTIYPVGGLKITDIRDDDIKYAVKCWYEPVYVELGQDGKPWVNS